MSTPVLIMGRSGSGKTASLRNMPPESTYLISVIDKDLPFPKGKEKFKLSTETVQGNRKIIFGKNFSFDYVKSLASNKPDEAKKYFASCSDAIEQTIQKISDRLPHIKSIVIDDTQYLMAYEVLGRAYETGFGKWSEVALNFGSILSLTNNLRDDLIIYLLHHTEVSDEGMIVKAKTAGKLIDNTLTVEGLFSWVFHSKMVVMNGVRKYILETQSDGKTTAKTPIGAFADFAIDNDLTIIESTIRNY